MKVLYIGGTGEISYECVRRSAEIGQQVTVFNRGRGEEPLPPGVRRIVGDLADEAAYARLGEEGFDVVCQFLAYQKPPKHHVITEDTPRENPYWAYSRAKAQMEAYLLEQHRAGTLPVTIVRPSHTYRRRFPGGIAGGDDWAWRLLNGKPIVVHGDGTSLWTLTHSSDFAVPFANLLGNDRALGQAFHVTRHMEAHPWNDIVAEVARALGTAPKIVHVPTETLVRYNADWAGPLLGDKSWSVLFDNRKVMSVAGDWRCRVSLPEGMKRAAEHYFRFRAPAYQADPKLHALLDRIAAEQSALGAA